jgi:hypothetical protein
MRAACAASASQMIERRVKEKAPGVLNALRVRLESGDPP